MASFWISFSSSVRTDTLISLFIFFFFNAPATTEIYTLSLHDALSIWAPTFVTGFIDVIGSWKIMATSLPDRKSTRLNSSHRTISYAVFCLKKKTGSQETNGSDNSEVMDRIVADRLIG